MNAEVKFELREKAKGKPSKFLPKTLEQRLESLPTGAALVLGLIALAGFSTMAVFAPNAVQLFGKFLYKKTGRIHTRNEAEAKLLYTVYYLKKTGKIKIEQENDTLLMKLGRLTRRDKEKLSFDTMVLPRSKTWDNTFWLAAADIPSKTHRLAADAFRKKITSLGFYPLQRTLWLYPYNPAKELQFLLNHFDINHFVTLMHVDKFDSQDVQLAKKFWLERNIL